MQPGVVGVGSQRRHALGQRHEDGRRRRPPLGEQLPPQRGRRERLREHDTRQRPRHQPGRRGGRRILRPHQLLLRRVRPHVRRRRQRHHALGHQPDPRHGVRVPPQQPDGRARLLRSRRAAAALPSQPVRRRLRRPADQEPDVLVRRLRRPARGARPDDGLDHLVGGCPAGPPGGRGGDRRPADRPGAGAVSAAQRAAARQRRHRPVLRGAQQGLARGLCPRPDRSQAVGEGQPQRHRRVRRRRHRTAGCVPGQAGRRPIAAAPRGVGVLAHLRARGRQRDPGRAVAVDVEERRDRRRAEPGPHRPVARVHPRLQRRRNLGAGPVGRGRRARRRGLRKPRVHVLPGEPGRLRPARPAFAEDGLQRRAHAQRLRHAEPHRRLVQLRHARQLPAQRAVALRRPLSAVGHDAQHARDAHRRLHPGRPAAGQHAHPQPRPPLRDDDHPDGGRRPGRAAEGPDRSDRDRRRQDPRQQPDAAQLRPAHRRGVGSVRHADDGGPRRHRRLRRAAVPLPLRDAAEPLAAVLPAGQHGERRRRARSRARRSDA